MVASFSGGCRACAYAVCSKALLPQLVPRVGDVAGRSFQMDLACGVPPPVETCLSGVVAPFRDLR